MASESPVPGSAIRSAQSISVAVFAGLLAQLSLAADLSVTLGLGLYCLAGYFFYRSLSQDKSLIHDHAGHGLSNRTPGPPALSVTTTRIEWLLVFFVFLVACLLRFYRIDSQPVALSLDEGLTGLNALE
ncbi:MAG TPA: hypothetical protein VJQ55_17150, partial [Candidatus Binatia bacterium]|nr:hypothetical protein [Candidatus Binatia bacterium]